MTFFDWLGRQTARQDAIGAFARHAVKDKVFPRNGRLHLILLRYEGLPERRNGAKAAHKEWRSISPRRAKAGRTA